jgi:hypothetical protein
MRKHTPTDDLVITETHRSPDWRSAPNGILTVADLRRWIAGLPDDTQVVIGNTDGWYDNVEGVHLPAEEYGEYVAVTLVPGRPYDTRQA